MSPRVTERGAGRSATATESLFGATTADQLKEKSVRGGVVTVLAQGLKFGLHVCSTAALARLLSPADFGLQAMVAVLIGFLALFRDAGLSVASIQREVLTQEQTSTLFWINVAVGAGLTLSAIAMAPLVAGFYREPRLLSITMACAVTFLLSGLAVQHRALLNRSLRFVTIAKIDLLSFATGAATGITMAALGCGYWSLVGMAVSQPLTSSIAVWIAMPWLPGRPVRRAGVRSMLRMGGMVTLTTLVVYLAYNTEKLLLGRFWGAEWLGLYGRAYHLATVPVQQLNGSIGSVAFPALSRVHGDAARFSRLFLKGYSVVISLTLVITMISAVFAEEIVLIVLGPKWTASAALLRLLAPAVLVFGVINPLSWFLRASGRVNRSLGTALLIAPFVITGIVVGLPHGPAGVATGFSAAMLLVMVPIIVLATHGTEMTSRDYWNTMKPPLASAVVAGVAGGIFKLACGSILPPIVLLILGSILLLGAYAGLLLALTGDRRLYTDALGQAWRQVRPGRAG